MNPRQLAEEQFKQIHNQFSDQEDILRNTAMSDEDFNNAMTELQSKYVAAKSKFDMGMAELDTVERLTQQGMITPEAANEAMFKMVVPPETAAAMYPKQSTPERTSPFLPGTLQNFDETILNFAEFAPDKKGLEWGRPAKTQSGLTASYMKWRKYVQYDEHDSSRQKQLDMEWDSVMAGDDRYEWDPSKPEVRILRSKGPIGSAIANRKFRTPTKMTGNGPMQVGIAKQLPQNQQTHKPADPLGLR